MLIIGEALYVKRIEKKKPNRASVTFEGKEWDRRTNT